MPAHNYVMMESVVIMSSIQCVAINNVIETLHTFITAIHTQDNWQALFICANMAMWLTCIYACPKLNQ